jgi:hypothetical protein
MHSDWTCTGLLAFSARCPCREGLPKRTEYHHPVDPKLFNLSFVLVTAAVKMATFGDVRGALED